MRTIYLLFFTLSFGFISAQPCIHPSLGTEASSPNGEVTIKLIDKCQNYGGHEGTASPLINSPKSVNIHPSGKKYYINSLEGGNTVVFNAKTNELITAVSHNISEEHDGLWSKPSKFYEFTHYPKDNHFMGKPVESTFTHGGKYLWVPYYRRSYDVNAQDPSAVAIIDTDSDKIVKLMETGPLPKMITVSPDGRYVAISHWGNNTVALIDIKSSNPNDWYHKEMYIIDSILPLYYSLTSSIDRDNSSGYCLRGTVFTPDNKYLLVGCMGNSGGIAVIDMKAGKYLGRVLGMMSNLRHIVLKGGYLYLSINAGGCVQKCKLSGLLAKAKELKGEGTVVFSDWQTCKVGTGARTICLSPSGKYIFTACNNVSQIWVVDSEKMEPLCHIDADSYPVGMDISDDGKYLYTTSQGRGHSGGNCVDTYEITYAKPEPKGLSNTPEAYEDKARKAEQERLMAEKQTDEDNGIIAFLKSIWEYIFG